MTDEFDVQQQKYECLKDVLHYLNECNMLVEDCTNECFQSDYFMDMDRVMMILEHQMWDAYLCREILALKEYAPKTDDHQSKIEKIEELRHFLLAVTEVAAQS